MRSAKLEFLFILWITAFPTSAVADSTCESMGLITCDNVCIDASSDNNHCGGCYRPCDVANNFLCCNWTCTDLASDPQNCGSCGAVCQDNEPCYTIVCINGTCHPGQTDKDSDDDTYFDGNCQGGTDCDDSDPDINPGAHEGPAGDISCADGRDNDCDTITDSFDPGCCWCSVHADCDDYNTCTQDRCADCMCYSTPLADGMPCDDFNPCTVSEYCTSGVCGDGAATDADGDTFIPEPCGGSDCDDSDPGINPFATEVCGDGVDQDCNGMDLECGCADADLDGFFDEACGGSDCDDGDDGNNPDAEEVCDDGVDNDCDGLTDTDELECPQCMSNEECDDGTVCTGTEVCVNTVCYAGTPLDCDDGNICTDDRCDPIDGCKYTYNTVPCREWIFCRPAFCQEGICTHGDHRDCGHLDDSCSRGYCSEVLNSCVAEPFPDGVACDDEDPCTMDEACLDAVCTGGIPTDADSDGVVADGCGGNDCDDNDADTHPGAVDWCDDGIDQDCNGSDLDCDCRDLDGDDYEDEACGGRDCDDADAHVNPDADEVCHDEVDNDCDGYTDREDEDCCPPEDCDWVDDDCDGITDNMGTETCGLGPCQVTVEVCVDGVLQECVPLRPQEFVEISCTDGIDNDCDGNIDYEDINCRGRVDAGHFIDGQLTGGGCGCGSTDAGGFGLLLAVLGLLIGRRNM